jgi:hypothetical protein
MRIRDPGWKKFGSEVRDGKSRIRDRDREKHPGSATLVPNKYLDFNTIRLLILMKDTYYVRESKLTILYDQQIDASGYKHMAINLFTVR